MGFFGGLNTEAYDRQYSDPELLRRILRYFAPHRRRVLGIALLITALALVGAARPFIVSRGLDLLVTSPQRLDVVLGLGTVVLVLGIVNWGGNWLRRRLTARVIGEVVLGLRHDAFQASVRHDMSFFDEFQSGRIISRIRSSSTFEPLRKAICTMRPSSAAARRFRSM